MELSLDVWSSETRPDGKLKMTAHIIRAVRGKKLKKKGGGELIMSGTNILVNSSRKQQSPKFHLSF